MRLRAEQLTRHLRDGLAPVYLVSGDEPLLLDEATDAIRQAARAAGHENREVMEAGPGFEWDTLLAEAASFSLFAEKKIIDLRLPNGKPGREGGQALTEYCGNPPADTLLLLTLPKLERQQQNSKWFKAIETLGVVIQVWPVELAKLPGWIGQRLRQAGLEPTQEAIGLLSERVEGNLLAAKQEIEKLRLLRGEGPLDAEGLAEAVADSARYDVFDLVDSALAAELPRCLHILEGLRGEGVAAAVVLWALHREISQLAAVALDTARGLSMDHAMSQARIWEKRKPLARQALNRHKPAQWLSLLDTCQTADAAIKGADPRNPWMLFEQILASLCRA